MATSAFPYIGSKISLISNIGIRYEGILYSINTADSTVALQHVKSYGTENRKMGGQVHPPRDEIYDFVVFKGKDIQDLTVSEPPPSTVLDDPAIVSINSHAHGPPNYPGHGGAPHPQGHPGVVGGVGLTLADPAITGGTPRRGGSPTERYPHPGNRSRYPMNGPNGGPHGSVFGPQGPMGPPMDMMTGLWNPRGNYGPRRGYGYGLRGGRGRGGGGGVGRIILGELPAQLNEAVKCQVEDAFDFEGANAKFKTVEEDGAKPVCEVTAGYNKEQSFFDSISCETLDRENGVDSRVDRERQRQVDVETFGSAASALERNSRFRRGFRSRGGGYRRGRGGMGGPGGMRSGPWGRMNGMMGPQGYEFGGGPSYPGRYNML